MDNPLVNYKRLKQELRGYRIGDNIIPDGYDRPFKILAFGYVPDNFITRLYDDDRIGKDVAIIEFEEGTMQDNIVGVEKRWWWLRAHTICLDTMKMFYTSGGVLDKKSYGEWSQLSLYRNSIIDDYRLKGGSAI